MHDCQCSWKPPRCPQAVVRYPGCHACGLCGAKFAGPDLFALPAPSSPQQLSRFYTSSAQDSNSRSTHVATSPCSLSLERGRSKFSQHSWSRITTYCCGVHTEHAHPHAMNICNLVAECLQFEGPLNRTNRLWSRGWTPLSLIVTVGYPSWQNYSIVLLSVMWLLRDAGVIWRGDSLIDGVPETLDLLRSLVSTLFCAYWRTLPGCRTTQLHFGTLQGKKLVFVTNNSTKSRAGYLSKFKKLGLNVTAVSIPAVHFAT